MPAVAAGASWSLWATGLPVERLLAENITAVVLACAVGGTLGAVILCTPSPIPSGLRKRATIVTAMAIPAAAGIGIGMLRLALGRLPAPEKQIPLCDVDRCRGWGVGGTVCMTRPPHISRAHAKSHISDNSPD
jgi:hypothetical protein